MSRVAALLAVLAALPALADPWLIRSSRLPTDHVNQDMLARSLDLSAAAGSASLTLRGNICLDASCTGKLWRDANNGGIRMNDTLFVDTIAANLWITNTTSGQPIYLNDGEGTRFSCVNSLPACQTGVPSGTFTTICSDYTVYWCGPTGWETIATTGNSQLVNGDTDIGPRSVIAQASSSEYAFKAVHNAKWDIGTGTNDEIYSDGTIIYGSIWYISQVGANQLNPKTGNRTTYIGSDGLRFYPLGAATCSSSSDTGSVSALNSDSRLYYCDGTTNQRVAFVLSATANINFASMGSDMTDTKTMTVTGAATTDFVTCGPVNGGSFGGVDVRPVVTSANTVTLTAYNDTAGVVDPSATDVTCIVIR